MPRNEASTGNLNLDDLLYDFVGNSKYDRDTDGKRIFEELFWRELLRHNILNLYREYYARTSAKHSALFGTTAWYQYRSKFNTAYPKHLSEFDTIMNKSIEVWGLELNSDWE